ncbi:sodium:solute symporter family protein [Eubacteriales bacterium OttesenSCG-928-M02]|nr:sodium:solute symporter family protein [Eubacteriales bacterium OttesenSCG-928-M02]
MQFAFLAAYAVALVSVSAISHRKTKTLDDFQLAGRNVGPWLSAFSYGTTYFSAVIFIGYAGKLGWSFGIATALIGIGNSIFGSYLPWRMLGERTRAETRRLSVSTMPEYFRARYDSKALKILSALVIFFFLTPYCASVYQGLAYLFEATLGIPFFWCMLFMAVATALYLVFGGYMANVMSNFIQGILMVAGVLLMMFFLFRHMGGVGNALTNLQAMQSGVEKAPFSELLWLILMTSFGTWGLPQMVQKFYAIKDKKAVKTGTIVSTLFALLIGGCAYLAGAFGKVILSGNVPVDSQTGLNNFDMVVPKMLETALPPMALSFILVLVLAASMSTLGSLVMVSASALGVDLIKGVFRPNMKERHTKALLQVLCVVFVGISLVIALSKNTSIVSLMAFSWGTVSGFCIGPYVLGILYKGTTRLGALSGGIASLCISIGLAVLWGGAKAPLIACIAMGVSMVVTLTVSLLSRQKNKKAVTE